MIYKRNILCIESGDCIDEVMSLAANQTRKPVLAARGDVCLKMMALAEHPELFAAALACEPWIDPVCAYGSGQYRHEENENLSSLLDRLFEDAYFPTNDKPLCPILILKRYDEMPFGTIQAETLFNRIKSSSPHTNVVLLLYKAEKKAEAQQKAALYLQEMAGITIEE